jgi:hypothetical protein
MFSVQEAFESQTYCMSIGGTLLWHEKMPPVPQPCDDAAGVLSEALADDQSNTILERRRILSSDSDSVVFSSIVTSLAVHRHRGMKHRLLLLSFLLCEVLISSLQIQQQSYDTFNPC